MQQQSEGYSNIIAKGTKILVESLEAKLEPCLANMSRIQWGNDDLVVGTKRKEKKGGNIY